MRTLLNMTIINKYDIVNHHLIQICEGLCIRNKSLRKKYPNPTHLFYTETSVCNYNSLAKNRQNFVKSLCVM